MTDAYKIRYYILQPDHSVTSTDDVLEWARQLESGLSERGVARDEINGVIISTVFIGLDHQFFPGGPPLIFETMIFEGPRDQDYQTRCSTYEEALVMHATAVALVKRDATWRGKCLLVYERLSSWWQLQLWAAPYRWRRYISRLQSAGASSTAVLRTYSSKWARILIKRITRK